MMASREILKMHGEIQAIGERTISGTLDFQNEPKPAVSIYSLQDLLPFRSISAVLFLLTLSIVLLVYMHIFISVE